MAMFRFEAFPGAVLVAVLFSLVPSNADAIRLNATINGASVCVDDNNPLPPFSCAFGTRLQDTLGPANAIFVGPQFFPNNQQIVSATLGRAEITVLNSPQVPLTSILETRNLSVTNTGDTPISGTILVPHNGFFIPGPNPNMPIFVPINRVLTTATGVWTSPPNVLNAQSSVTVSWFDSPSDAICCPGLDVPNTWNVIDNPTFTFLNQQQTSSFSYTKGIDVPFDGDGYALGVRFVFNIAAHSQLLIETEERAFLQGVCVGGATCGIPEPSVLTLFAFGLAALGVFRRRNQ